jgi:hypothetical protein
LPEFKRSCIKSDFIAFYGLSGYFTEEIEIFNNYSDALLLLYKAHFDKCYECGGYKLSQHLKWYGSYDEDDEDDEDDKDDKDDKDGTDGKIVYKDEDGETVYKDGKIVHKDKDGEIVYKDGKIDYEKIFKKCKRCKYMGVDPNAYHVEDHKCGCDFCYIREFDPEENRKIRYSYPKESY